MSEFPANSAGIGDCTIVHTTMSLTCELGDRSVPVLDIGKERSEGGSFGRVEFKSQLNVQRSKPERSVAVEHHGDVLGHSELEVCKTDGVPPNALLLERLAEAETTAK